MIDRFGWQGWRMRLGALMVSAALGLQGAESKLAPDLLDLDPDKEVDVIIQYRETAEEGTGRPTVRFALPSGIAPRRGAEGLSLIGAVGARATRARLEQLARDSRVAYISPDREVRATAAAATPAAANYTLPLALANTRADQASVRGVRAVPSDIYSKVQNIGIAIIDSGVRLMRPAGPHYLNPMSLPPIPFYAEWMFPIDDTFGHGSHVSGVATSDGWQVDECRHYYVCPTPLRASGVAPGAKVISFQVLNEKGAGTDTAVINAIKRAIALKDTFNIKVINLSLGRGIKESYTKDPLCQAVEKAWKAGITVVVAAGNRGDEHKYGTNGYGSIGSPANDPYVITVGATKSPAGQGRESDLMASYSSKRPTMLDRIVKPDLVAPGNKVISDGHPELSYNNNEFYQMSSKAGVPWSRLLLSGTSMAAPMVSGAAALLYAADPGISPDTVKARLMRAAAKSFFPKGAALLDSAILRAWRGLRGPTSLLFC